MVEIAATVAGIHNSWNLLQKLGEGDAGEIFLVRSLVGGEIAILKRPHIGPFYSDVLRQASQIRTEAEILNALKGIQFPNLGTVLSTPAVLDQSPPEEGIGERFFMIIERAAGIDLKSLANLTHFGLIDETRVSAAEENEFFIQMFSGFNEIPEPILIRSLSTVLNLIETIHSAEVWNGEVKHSGIVWNDIKPEHLYWDPKRACLTVIDWGNSNYLEEDGATQDRQHSTNDDFYQFVQAIGEFLADANPDLHARLEWPRDIARSNAYSEGVRPLKERLLSCNDEALSQVQDLRKAIAELYAVSRPELTHLNQSDDLQRQMVAYGELPDFASALNFHARVALKLAGEANLQAFRQVAGRTAKLPGASAEKWELLSTIAEIALEQSPAQEKHPTSSFGEILSAGIADDWPVLLWGLLLMVGENPLPSWWESVTQGIRRVYLKLDDDSLPPYTVISRLYHTFRAAVMQLEDDQLRANLRGEQPVEKVSELANLVKLFNDEILKKWDEIDPAPPNSGVGYDDVDGFIADIEPVLPGTQEKIEKALAQPKAQAAIFQNAWERKDFETARKVLRLMLVWDPDRRRLLRAERAIGTAPRWLAKIIHGAAPDEPFYDYLTSVELAGRNLRSRVGPAQWLDLLLDTLKKLRKGSRPADLFMEHPELMNEIPWLNEHRSREVLSLARSRPLALERDIHAADQVRTVVGMQEGRLGEGQDLFLTDPLDSWIPEARGSIGTRIHRQFARCGGKTFTVCSQGDAPRPGRICSAAFHRGSANSIHAAGCPGHHPTDRMRLPEARRGIGFSQREEAQFRQPFEWRADPLRGRGGAKFPVTHGSTAVAGMAALPGAGQTRPGTQPDEILRRRA